MKRAGIPRFEFSPLAQLLNKKWWPLSQIYQTSQWQWGQSDGTIYTNSDNNLVGESGNEALSMNMSEFSHHWPHSGLSKSAVPRSCLASFKDKCNCMFMNINNFTCTPWFCVHTEANSLYLTANSISIYFSLSTQAKKHHLMSLHWKMEAQVDSP